MDDLPHPNAKDDYPPLGERDDYARQGLATLTASRADQIVSMVPTDDPDRVKLWLLRWAGVSGPNAPRVFQRTAETKAMLQDAADAALTLKRALGAIARADEATNDPAMFLLSAWLGRSLRPLGESFDQCIQGEAAFHDLREALGPLISAARSAANEVSPVAGRPRKIERSSDLSELMMIWKKATGSEPTGAAFLRFAEASLAAIGHSISGLREAVNRTWADMQSRTESYKIGYLD